VTTTISINHQTFVTCVAALMAAQMRKPDPRNVDALADLRRSFNDETQREIDSVRELPRTPAFLRKQAG
jgi:hypothetical protein